MSGSKDRLPVADVYRNHIYEVIRLQRLYKSEAKCKGKMGVDCLLDLFVATCRGEDGEEGNEKKKSKYRGPSRNVPRRGYRVSRGALDQRGAHPLIVTGTFHDTWSQPSLFGCGQVCRSTRSCASGWLCARWPTARPSTSAASATSSRPHSHMIGASRSQRNPVSSAEQVPSWPLPYRQVVISALLASSHMQGIDDSSVCWVQCCAGAGRRARAELYRRQA